MRARLNRLAAAALAAAIVLTGPRPAAAGPFENHWQDGRAELAGYRYAVTRYGARREGECVMVTVTEPFSISKRVKADAPSRNRADVFEALKLNLVRDFPTGIYDYNTMVSVFTRSQDFSPVKVSFTSAEWCGHVYEEQTFEPRHVTSRVRSYFEDESRVTRLPMRTGGVAEDDLFILLRGLRGAYLAPGARRSVPFLPSPFHTRLTHRPARWLTAEITRDRARARVTVPAGTFAADVYRVRVSDGRSAQFFLETAYPHRILKWTWSPGPLRSGMGRDGADQGELLRSTRLPYWKLNGVGDERHLRELGLRR